MQRRTLLHAGLAGALTGPVGLTATGRLFEVTPAGEVVWEYVIPWFAEYPDEAARKYVPGRQNSVFQTFRYTAAQLPWLKVSAP
jgi:hypothetical protein